MTMGSESELEKFIVDFVWQKTMQRVRLHLADEITVRPLNMTRTGRFNSRRLHTALIQLNSAG